MAWLYCSSHGVRYLEDSQCGMCCDENSARIDAERQLQATRELAELQRRREAEEGVCDCCGQRFIERTRVRPTRMWNGVLAKYFTTGVCPACANRYGAV
jgi:hypothetical protein